MSPSKVLNVAFGLSRVGFGIFASSAPQLVGRTWIGDEADRPGAGVILRALGFRDIALGAGTLDGALRNNARGWLAVCMLSDMGDVATTLIGRNQIDRKGVLMTTVFAGSGAVASGVLLALNECDRSKSSAQ